MENLEKSCREELESEGNEKDSIELERFLRLRYNGTDFPLMISEKEVSDIKNIEGRTLNNTC